MVVLGIDPGTHCGWCALPLSGEPLSGVWELKGSRYEGGGMRFLRLRQQLSELLDRVNPDVVAYEEVHGHKGVDAAHIYGGIIAVLTMECERRNVPYMGVGVGIAKKRATGKGNAKKEHMIASAQKHWPGWSGCDNEADARWVAVCGMDEMTKNAREVLG